MAKRPVFEPVPLTINNAMGYLRARENVRSIDKIQPGAMDGQNVLTLHFTYKDGSKGSADIWQEPEGLYGEW